MYTAGVTIQVPANFPALPSSRGKVGFDGARIIIYLLLSIRSAGQWRTESGNDLGVIALPCYTRQYRPSFFSGTCLVFTFSWLLK